MSVLVLFFCSGASALIYEVVWSKYLSLLLGSTIQAQTVVLAAFMGGLALGNRLFGRVADRSAQPLALYGYLEVAIGLYAFVFDALYHTADLGFQTLGKGLAGEAGNLLLMKALLGVVLLLGPTILMGGTLPLVAGWLQQRYPDASRWSARFYSVNSLGAVAGAALAGFVLVRHLGMMSSLQLTAIVNVLVGITAVVLSRREGGAAPRDVPAASRAVAVVDGPATGDRRVVVVACVLVALTGGVSMGLEVLASRSLVLIVGASLQAFAIVLMAFILGIGLGSAVVASPRFRHLPWAPTAVVVLLVAAAWVGCLVVGIEQWVTVYRQLKTGLGRTDMGFQFHQLLTAALSLGVLGVPAALIGAVLPVCLRGLGGAGELGRRVGRLLTWNTVGAVVGSLLTGFLLMPAFGLRTAFLVHVVLLCAAAIVLAWSLRLRSAVFAGAIVAVALVWFARTTGDDWRYVFSSGVFRIRETEVASELMDLRRRTVRLLFYEDAADATVSVEEDTSEPAQPTIVLRVNGKPDASTSLDLGTQYLAGHLPLILKPDAQDVFVLGLGSGATAGAVLQHPVERVVIAENCEPVLRAAKYFESVNCGVLTNTRARIVLDDGRTVLKLSPKPYDVIINEPSNPWMVGVGGVFSREYYDLCSSRLKDGGLVLQWFHVYEMDDEIVSLVLRTFAKAFPYMEVWDANGGDLLMVGGHQPWPTGVQLFAKAFERPAVRAQLQALGFTRPESLWVRQLASQRTARAVGGPGPLQTDNFPVLEYDAPRAFYVGGRSRYLLRFDERLWQEAFAPAEKRTVLSQMPDEEIRRVFSTYGSSIRDMADHVIAHSPRGRGTNGHPHPCIFRPEEWAGTLVPVPGDASPEDRRVLEAVARLRQTPASWKEDIQIVLAALHGRSAAARDENEAWSVVSVARDAATAALTRGDPALAGEVLSRALELRPQAPELVYLRTLLEQGIAAESPTRARIGSAVGASDPRGTARPSKGQAVGPGALGQATDPSA